MQNINQRSFPPSGDTLGETFYSLRLNGVIYANSELTAPWGIEMPAMEGKMMFHIVTEGSCQLQSAHEQVQLTAGDLVLLPLGKGHSIASDKSIGCTAFFDLPVTRPSERFEILRYGGGGEYTHLICGVLSFDQVAGTKPIAQLPAFIHTKSDSGELANDMNALMTLMAEEAQSLHAGGETIIAHLADIIVIKAIRHWIEHAPEASQGWLGGLKDPKISKALAAIHNQPESAWTVDQLAKQAGMSRSGFSARFTEIIGTSVKQYLTEWRMSLARMRIMHSPVTLTELAEALGYQSEAAFSRAYKRINGEPPLRQK